MGNAGGSALQEAVDDSRNLLAGDVIVGTELAVVVAVDAAVLGSPFHSGSEPVAAADVLEGQTRKRDIRGILLVSAVRLPVKRSPSLPASSDVLQSDRG